MREYEYDVALSFAGEDRQHAEALAELLANKGYKVFYDVYEQAQLWGKDLYTQLSAIYKDKARYCVMFLSEHYAHKLWTNHERESAQARAFGEKEEYILPVRLDNTEIPGILRTLSYLDLRSGSIDKVYQALVEKLPNPLSQRAIVPATPSGLKAELLEKIKDNPPNFFEELILDLLVEMGYSIPRPDAETMRRSGDTGIDAIISQDKLGFDLIHVEMKLWKEISVGSPDIRRFSGALIRQGASKGLFITTSTFSDPAKALAKEMTDPKIILIDGNQLVQLMIEHNVGIA